MALDLLRVGDVGGDVNGAAARAADVLRPRAAGRARCAPRAPRARPARAACFAVTRPMPLEAPVMTIDLLGERSAADVHRVPHSANDVASRAAPADRRRRRQRLGRRLPHDSQRALLVDDLPLRRAVSSRQNRSVTVASPTRRPRTTISGIQSAGPDRR